MNKSWVWDTTLISLGLGLVYTFFLKNHYPVRQSLVRKPIHIENKLRTRATPCAKVNAEPDWFKSQSAEDKKLMMFFNGLCGGRYVELGALDGVTYSNTYVFNKALGWKGVLMDVSPANYALLQVNRQDEESVLHAAVCKHDDFVHYVEAGAVGGVWEFTAPTFRRDWWGVDASIENAHKISCVPLRDIFFNISGDFFYADFLSLDVEGSELTVLESIDFTKAAFGVVLIEADGHNLTKNVAVRDFMVTRHYIFLYWYERSDWFMHEKFRDIYQSSSIGAHLAW